MNPCATNWPPEIGIDWHHADNWLAVMQGDWIENLRRLPDGCAHCCVTSPPYWGLRNYGVEGQLGLERTPEEYVAKLVAGFREVRRVLRDDGSLWLNLGDSYANDGKWGGTTGGKHVSDLHGELIGRGKRETGLKPKDLVGIPWRVAFALQADGWVLRQEIIWEKPNPMPESVTDRCTKAHEQIFMFAKAKWCGLGAPHVWISQCDAAWLAALVDGEGSICFQESSESDDQASTFSPRLSVVNTNLDLLNRAAEICNVNIGPGSPSPRHRSDGTTGRPVYSWQLTNAKAACVIAAIRPHLIAKARQADLALFVHVLNQKHKGGRGGHRTDPSDCSLKAKAAEACSLLNRTGDADLSWFTPIRWGRWDSQPYYFDAEAIKEPACNDHARGPNNFAVSREATGTSNGHSGLTKYRENYDDPDRSRNKRSVWTVPSQAYPESHFATFPEDLIKPCILAGTSARGCCPKCGAPWERVVESQSFGKQDYNGKHSQSDPSSAGRNILASVNAARKAGGAHDNPFPPKTTIGWQPTCECGETQTVPCTVLDPFAGSGTTGQVALELGRKAILIELNPKYAELIKQRTYVTPGFAGL